jgi:divalent metal cation (Fe/Co/Zn/Cd) transporter
MHLVVPKQMTVEAGHALSHKISADIEQCLSHSHILVHIEPCPGSCDSCSVVCPKIFVSSPAGM